MSKKILVVGCGNIGIASKIADELHNKQVEVVAVENCNEIEANKIKDPDMVFESRELEMPKSISESFYPRAKHCKKGHERGYKYHK